MGPFYLFPGDGSNYVNVKLISTLFQNEIQNELLLHNKTFDISPGSTAETTSSL